MTAMNRSCQQCGAVVPDGHHYCGRCGAFFAEDGSDTRKDTMFFGAMQAPGRAKLILVRGEGTEGLSYHLNGTKHGAGRSKGVILFLEDRYMSPSHATFLYRENRLYVRDEQSANGTFLRIRTERELEDGDEIMIGEQLLRLEKLDLRREYPMREDTLMYVSPPKNYKFRLVQKIRGAKPGAAFASVNNDLLIGREGCDVNFTEDRFASRQHARVTWREDKVVVTDLDSKNGTFARIRDEEQLRHGDYVQMGSELMRVEINA